MNPPHPLGPWWGRLALRCYLASLLLVAFGRLPARAQNGTPDPCDQCNLGGTGPNGCHEPPEFWVINTRCAPRCRNLDEGFQKIRFQRYDTGCHRFVTKSRESFLATEACLPTLFYAHGNYLDHPRAMKTFWQVYRKLRCCPGPKRLVCWSWPAQRVYRGLRIGKMVMDNLRIKAVYAEYQGYYLASLVRQMSRSRRVMLTGHSFGAIVVSSAAHWLGGGQLRGLTLTGGDPVEWPNLMISLISGAIDNDALLPGYRYGQAVVAVENLLITRNRRDSALRIWNKVSNRDCPAIGLTGLNANRLGPYRDKLCQLTVTSDVHRSHFLGTHLNSTRLMTALFCLSFPQYQASTPLALEKGPASAPGPGADNRQVAITRPHGTVPQAIVE